MKPIMLFVLIAFVSQSAFSAIQKETTTFFYVSKKGCDSNDGTKKAPFATIERTKEVVRQFKKSGNFHHPITVVIQKGHYELDQPLVFLPEDAGTEENPVIYQAQKGAKVTLSGGRHISEWEETEKNHWVASLPEVKSGDWYFRQLFAGERRLERARTPNQGFFITKGALSKYAKTLGRYTWNQKIKKEDPAGYWESRTGFNFKPGDITFWKNWQEAEILTFHSWESSWQTIRSIDTLNNDVYFNSPCRYPVGTFGQHMRYRVENVPEALDMPGEWYLDGKRGELHFLANEGEDPNKMDIHAPFLDQMLVFKGTSQEPVAHLNFKNIDFKYVKYQLGLYDIDPQWPNEIKKGIPDFPDTPRPGFTDSQAAPRCGQSVEMEESEKVTFEKCRFNHLGGYAVKIGRACRNIAFNGCEMYDLGGGGVLIGFPIRNVKEQEVPERDAPAHNVISNCYIHSAGKVHPAAVGVWIAQSHHNKILNNEIADISYSGVSTGWTWGGDFNYTKSNTISNNYIHYVAQLLGDAAGIYSLGNCSGTVYFENYLDQIAKGDGVHGVVDALGFDEMSRNIRIERNVVGKISGKVASFNKNKPEDHSWIENNFDMKVVRPVLKHLPEMEAEKITVVADFELASSFLNLQGWTEQRWILSKNGGQNDDGYFGLVVEGKKVVGIMNIGGGSEGRYAVSSENVLVDDQLNRVALTYDGSKLLLYVNGKSQGVLTVDKKRKEGSGKLIIAPVTANSLRNGVEELRIFDRVLSSNEISSYAKEKEDSKASFYWKAPEKEIANIDFDKIKKNAGPKKEYRKFLRVSKK